MAKDDDLIGKVEEKVGWLTGDRQAEAKGKLRRLGATDDAEQDEDEDEEQAADAAKEAEKAVRSDYGEYDPDVDGATPAADVRPSD